MPDRKEIVKVIKCDYSFGRYQEPIDNVIAYFNDLKNQGATSVSIDGDGKDVWIHTESIRLETTEEYNTRLIKEEAFIIAETTRKQVEERAFYERLKDKFEKQ